MQICYNCGKEVSDETLICPDCGALVRRYTNPPPRMNEQPTQSEAPRQEWVPQQPSMPGYPQQQPWEMPQGQQKPQKLRLFGGVKVWLILLSVFSCYMAFSSFCTVILCLNIGEFMQIMQEAGMELYLEMLQQIQPLVPQIFPLFLALTILFVAKAVCHIWLLRSARRLPFLISIGASIVGLICIMILGGSILSVIYFFDPFFTWLGLKRFWLWMEK